MKKTRKVCRKTFEHPLLSKYLTKVVELLKSYQLIPSGKENIYHSPFLLGI